MGNSNEHDGIDNELTGEFVQLRPHHLLCTQAYVGKGYSAGFIRNADEVIAKLRSGTARVRIVTGADDLCAACPHLHSSGLCASQEIVERLDNAVITTFGITEGPQDYTALTAKLRQFLTPELLNSVCAPCGWLKTGLCTSFFFPTTQ